MSAPPPLQRAEPLRRLLVAGHFNLDDTFTAGRQVPMAAGGAAAYAAVGAWLAGGRVAVVTRVGRDHPTAIVARLERAGIEVHARRLDVPTMASATIYDRLGRRRFRMRNSRADLQQLTPSAQEVLAVPTDAVHLGPLPPATVRAIADGATGPLSLDSHPTLVRADRAGFTNAAAAADVLLLAEAEWRAWLGPGTPHRWLRRAPPGPSIIGVRRGALGALVVDTRRKELWNVPALLAHALDPTGAGDAFCGAFFARWISDNHVASALAIGAAAASVVVEHFGALPALDRREEMERRACAAESRLTVGKWCSRWEVQPDA